MNWGNVTYLGVREIGYPSLRPLFPVVGDINLHYWDL